MFCGRDDIENDMLKLFRKSICIILWALSLIDSIFCLTEHMCDPTLLIKWQGPYEKPS